MPLPKIPKKIKIFNKKPAVVIALITLAVFLASQVSITRAFIPSLAIILLLLLLAYPFVFKKKAVLQNLQFTYLLTAFIISLVAATGWFFSPFFFTLHLLAILLAFFFGLGTAVVFIATLTLLFSPNIGDIGAAIDILTLISLLAIIPLTGYIRKEYLSMLEKKGKIKILDKK